MINIYKIPLEKEEFLTAIKTDWTAFIKDTKNTTKAIALFATENNLIKQDFNTVSSMTKPKLRDLIIKAQEPQADAPKARITNNGSNSLASEIVDILEEIKIELQEKKLNPFIKKRAIKTIENLMNKIEDEKSLENLGMIGNIAVLLFTLIDVFIDLKTIPKKIKEFRSKRAKQATESKANAVKQ